MLLTKYHGYLYLLVVPVVLHLSLGHGSVEGQTRPSIPTPIIDGDQTQYDWEAIVAVLQGAGHDLPALDVPPSLRVDFVTLLDRSQRYAWGCGIGGVAPPGRRAVGALVYHRQTTPLRYVLRFGVLPGQVYAAEALLFLAQNGIPLPPEDFEIIEVLRRNSGALEVCHGCIISTESPREALSDKNLENLQEIWKWFLERFKYDADESLTTHSSGPGPAAAAVPVR